MCSPTESRQTPRAPATRRLEDFSNESVPVALNTIHERDDNVEDTVHGGQKDVKEDDVRVEKTTFKSEKQGANHVSNPSCMDANGRKLFVGGFSPSLKLRDFREYFSHFGTLSDSVIVFNKETHTSRCFGFVTFEDCSVAQHLLRNFSNGDVKIIIKGKECEIKAITPKTKTQNVKETRYAKKSVQVEHDSVRELKAACPTCGACKEDAKRRVGKTERSISFPSDHGQSASKGNASKGAGRAAGRRSKGRPPQAEKKNQKCSTAAVSDPWHTSDYIDGAILFKSNDAPVYMPTLEWCTLPYSSVNTHLQGSCMDTNQESQQHAQPISTNEMPPGHEVMYCYPTAFGYESYVPTSASHDPSSTDKPQQPFANQVHSNGYDFQTNGLTELAHSYEYYPTESAPVASCYTATLIPLMPYAIATGPMVPIVDDNAGAVSSQKNNI